MMTLDEEDEAMVSPFDHDFQQIWAGLVVADVSLCSARDDELDDQITPRRLWLQSLALLLGSLPAASADDVLYKLAALGLLKSHEDLAPSHAASLVRWRSGSTSKTSVSTSPS